MFTVRIGGRPSADVAAPEMVSSAGTGVRAAVIPGHITATHVAAGVAIVAAALSFILSGAPAVAETLLSLDQAVDIALVDGYEMKSLRLSLIQAEQSRLAAKYRFRTQVDLTLNTPSWSQRVSEVQVPNALPIYNNLGTLRYQTRLDISQPLPTDGTVTLRSNLYQSQESNFFAETGNTLKRKDFLTSFSLNLSQPLFTYNRLKTGLKRAELSYERQSLTLRRTRLDVVYNATSAFFALYRSTRSLAISVENLAQKQAQYETARLKFTAGLIPEVEALQLEVELASAQADNYDAIAALDRQREEFKRVLGLPLDEEVGVLTDIQFNKFDIDLDEAVRQGLANRTELREQDINLEMQNISVMETDARSQITAQLTAFYDFTGYSDPALPFSSDTRSLFDSSWQDIRRRPGNKGITMQISVPVWDWGVNKAEVASARVDLRRAELQRTEQEKTVIISITDAVRRVKTAENSLQVLEKSQIVAERSYQISLERFNNGEITGQDLAIDNNRLLSARLGYLNAYIAYRLAIEDLKRKTLYDFENKSPVTDEG